MKSASISSFKIFNLTKQVLRRFSGYIFLSCLSLLAIATRRTIFVITTPFGELGNRLFLYANFIAFAMEHDAIVINPAFRPWRNTFAGTRRGAVASYPPPPLPHLPGDLLERFVQELAWSGEAIANSPLSISKWVSIRLKGNECCNLDSPAFIEWALKKHVIFGSGWLFLSSSYMRIHAEDMGRYFGPAGEKSNRLLQPLRSRCDLIVGVLIRHGDYRQWMVGKYFFPTSTYIRWIREIVEIFPNQNIGFFITGNDDLLPEGIADIPHMFRSHRDPSTRFMLSECDYIIAPVSSFAGWAAYVGKATALILSSGDLTVQEKDFKPIFNHPDMRDESFPPDHDITDAIVSGSSAVPSSP